jgi:hypothetical protein
MIVGDKDLQCGQEWPRLSLLAAAVRVGNASSFPTRVTILLL